VSALPKGANQESSILYLERLGVGDAVVPDPEPYRSRGRAIDRGSLFCGWVGGGNVDWVAGADGKLRARCCAKQTSGSAGIR
jgi:hypothetical protein